MDGSQAVYTTGLIVALYCGRPHWLIAAAMVFDLAATLALSGNPIAVGTADMICAVALLFAGWRGRVVALIFALMQPVYVAAVALGWNSGTTYAIVDSLAFLQLGVIGGLDTGISSARRWLDRRRGNSANHPLEMGGHSGNGVARISAEGRG